ncbi:MAG: DUF2073 domain-containing protein [Nanoarchaeota archaeon]|nr:DUF2073 domain-containing protein [Nanoarchaeota archaeon]MCK5629306.1 DUF2073 domain-containing protein [Nanoarchaeota archaeon]
MVTLQLVPYSEIELLSSLGRIRKLLNIAKEDKIVLLQGRLKKEEEAELIKVTMEEINKDFRGIELAVVDPSSNSRLNGFKKVRASVVNALLGERQGLTIIGPASIVKEIKRDPTKIELLTNEISLKSKSYGKKKKRNAHRRKNKG